MRIETREGAVIVRLEDDVLFDRAEAFEAAVEEALRRGGKVLVIDFAGIEYLASQCLKTISVTASRLKEEGGELVFVNPTERIRALCRLTRLDWVVPILESEAEALGRARAAGGASPGTDAPDEGRDGIR